MTHTDRSPATVLEFSDDLVYADVDPLRMFLRARLGELADGQADGTDAHFTAKRLRDITDSDCIHISDSLSEWERVVARGQTDQAGEVQTLRQRIARWWNRLCRTADRFCDHPDFNPRWRELSYMCVEHAEFMEATDKGFTRDARYRPGAHP